MVPLEFIEDYFVDNEEGMRNLIIWFLNLVMQVEALHQAQADPYERTVTRRAHRNGHKERSLKMPLTKASPKCPASGWTRPAESGTFEDELYESS